MMEIAPLELIAPTPRIHREALIDLLAKTFSYHGYYTFRDVCRDYYIGHSPYDWQASRIGLVDGQIVTHFGVWEYLMRIGRGRVRVGGIGAVATDADYRKRGYMGHTAHAVLAAMRAQGYDMTVLFGIENYYHRFGYVRAWGETVHTAEVADLPMAAPALPIHKCAPRPGRALDELYNATYATTTGTAVRPVYTKAWTMLGLPPVEGYCWKGADGRLQGYVLCGQREQCLQCFEYGGDAQHALRVLGVLARRAQCTTLRVEAPYTSGLATLLRQGNCRVETRYRRSGEAMIRTLNLASTLEKLTGELSRRVQQSPLAGWQGTLLLADADERVLLAIHDGQVHVTAPTDTPHAIVGGNALAQLLIGTHPPQETVAAAQMQVTGDAEQLLPVLFPEQHPVLSHFDHY